VFVLSVRVAWQLREEATRQLFFDLSGPQRTGYLEPAQVIQAVKTVYPRMTRAQTIELLLHLRPLDQFSDGRVTFRELQHCLRLVKVVRASADEPESLQPWRLQEKRFERRMFAVDPETALVYDRNLADDNHPQLVGSLLRGVRYVPREKPVVFIRLEHYLNNKTDYAVMLQTFSQVGNMRLRLLPYRVLPRMQWACLHLIVLAAKRR
jgi:hypothetical protein